MPKEENKGINLKHKASLEAILKDYLTPHNKEILRDIIQDTFGDYVPVEGADDIWRDNVQRLKEHYSK